MHSNEQRRRDGAAAFVVVVTPRGAKSNDRDKSKFFVVVTSPIQSQQQILDMIFAHKSERV
jgi:hypothetical protein